MKRARVCRFVRDVPAGTVGTLVKRWRDPYGTDWVRLDFGRNLTGQRLRCSLPADCVEVVA